MRAARAGRGRQRGMTSVESAWLRMPCRKQGGKRTLLGFGKAERLKLRPLQKLN
jgi:hypothetical protein